MSSKRKQKKTKILGLVIVSLLLIVLVLGILFGAGILQLKKGTFEVSFENNGHGQASQKQTNKQKTNKPGIAFTISHK